MLDEFTVSLSVERFHTLVVSCFCLPRTLNNTPVVSISAGNSCEGMFFLPAKLTEAGVSFTVSGSVEYSALRISVKGCCETFCCCYAGSLFAKQGAAGRKFRSIIFDRRGVSGESRFSGAVLRSVPSVMRL